MPRCCGLIQACQGRRAPPVAPARPISCWHAWRSIAPAHPAVLNELGLRMMQRGDAARARELFQRATQTDPGHPALWSNLASSLHALNFLPEELDALERALALEPRHLPSLLQKGTLLEATGDPRNAARVYRNALATLPPGETPPRDGGVP